MTRYLSEEEPTGTPSITPEEAKEILERRKNIAFKQAQVAYYQNAAEHSVQADIEACADYVHNFLRDKAGHKFCYKCGQRLQCR